jgi:hypothetical protein
MSLAAVRIGQAMPPVSPLVLLGWLRKYELLDGTAVAL